MTAALAVYKFRLYIAGDTQNSVQAVANLTELCRTYLAGRYEIELVDVSREPKRALADGIMMTPTLVKLEPQPSETLVGNLSQTAFVLHRLGIVALGSDLQQTNAPGSANGQTGSPKGWNPLRDRSKTPEPTEKPGTSASGKPKNGSRS